MTVPERSILDDLSEAEDARRLAEAEADIAAGRLVPNEEVVRWLKTWGGPDETPTPAHWRR